jgi:uncharacterized protein YodC (DUF2158 family)
MATTFKKGDAVQLNFTPPQGTVESLRMDEDGNVQYLVAWKLPNGTPQSRWFDENDLVAV